MPITSNPVVDKLLELSTAGQTNEDFIRKVERVFHLPAFDIDTCSYEQLLEYLIYLSELDGGIAGGV